MISIEAVKCEHCDRKRYTGSSCRQRMTDHERHCYANPHRKPRGFELYGKKHRTTNRTLEARGWDENPPWEPEELGMMWFYTDGVGAWHKVPGYDPKTDTWPQVDRWETLDTVTTWQRHRWWADGCKVVKTGAEVYADAMARTGGDDIPF